MPSKPIFDWAPSFGSSSNLHVNKTGLKSWINSNFGQLERFTLELFALERRKFFPYFILCSHFQTSSPPSMYWTNWNLISCVAPLGQGNYICKNGLGHMAKMAAMPIYGKNPLKTFFSEIKDWWSWNFVQHLEHRPSKVHTLKILDRPWLSLGQVQIYFLMVLYHGKTRFFSNYWFLWFEKWYILSAKWLYEDIQVPVRSRSLFGHC